MGDVVFLNNDTRIDLPPDRVLESAIGKLKGVLIAGYDDEGYEYFASSYADGGDIIWLLERMKLRVLQGD